MWSRASLGVQIATVMVGLLAFVAVALGAIAYLPISEAVYSARLAGMSSSARLMALEIGAVVRNAAADAVLIAEAPAIRNMAAARWVGDPASEAVARTEAAGLLAALMRARPDYLQARLIAAGAEGFERVRIDRPVAGAPIRVIADADLQAKGDRDYVVEAMRKAAGDVYVSALDLNKEYGEIEVPHVPVERVATPVLQPNGDVYGIVVLNIDMRPALERLPGAVDSSVEVRLVDGAGRYLAHPEPARAFGFEFGDVRTIRDEYPEVRAEGGTYSIADAPLDVASDAVVETEDIEGQAVALAVAAVEFGDGQRALLLLTAPSLDVFASVRSSTGRYAIGASLIVLAAIILGLLTARTISGSLAQVVAALGRLRSGEPAAFPGGGASEVRALVSAVSSYVEQEDLFRAVAVGASDAILTVSMSGVVTSWNAAAARMLGYSAEQVVGQSAATLSPPDLADAHEALARRVNANEPTVAVTTRLRTRNGRSIDVEGSFSLIRGPDGAPAGRAAILRDVTTRNRDQELFRLAVEASPAAMVMVAASGRIALANQRTVELFGYREDELVGAPVELLLPPRAASVHPALRADFLGAPSQREMGAGRELSALRKDGSSFPVEVGLNPVEADEGLMTLAVVVDITERRRAEEMFRVAVESAPAAMILVGPDGCIVLANRETHAIFGYADSQLVGVSVEELVPQDVRAAHPHLRSAYLWKPERRRMGVGRELFAVRNDGELFPVEVGLNPISLFGQRLTLAVVVDITERQKAEVALRQRTDELEQSNEELRQLTYVTSHDLQEPLRMVSSFCSLLKEDYASELDAEATELIDFAVDGAKRMQRMIDDLLEYSRIQSSEMELRPVAAKDVIEEALANLAGAIADSEAEIEFDALPVVLGHYRLLTQLFQNLIGNSMKFRSDETPRIRIAAESRDGRWLFSVRDNGIGVDPEHRESIFSVFQRLHTREEYPGTGIGLAHCRRIVDRHGGRIWMEANEDSGSTFLFDLQPGADEQGAA